MTLPISLLTLGLFTLVIGTKCIIEQHLKFVSQYLKGEIVVCQLIIMLAHLDLKLFVRQHFAGNFNCLIRYVIVKFDYLDTFWPDVRRENSVVVNYDGCAANFFERIISFTLSSIKEVTTWRIHSRAAISRQTLY